MNLRPGQKMLDIGCGTGGTVYHVARTFGCYAHGVDVSQDMISLCKQRLNWEEEVVRQRVRNDYLKGWKRGFDFQPFF